MSGSFRNPSNSIPSFFTPPFFEPSAQNLVTSSSAPDVAQSHHQMTHDAFARLSFAQHQNERHIATNRHRAEHDTFRRASTLAHQHERESAAARYQAEHRAALRNTLVAHANARTLDAARQHASHEARILALIAERDTARHNAPRAGIRNAPPAIAEAPRHLPVQHLQHGAMAPSAGAPQPSGTAPPLLTPLDAEGTSPQSILPLFMIPKEINPFRKKLIRRLSTDPRKAAIESARIGRDVKVFPNPERSGFQPAGRNPDITASRHVMGGAQAETMWLSLSTKKPKGAERFFGQVFYVDERSLIKRSTTIMRTDEIINELHERLFQYEKRKSNRSKKESEKISEAIFNAKIDMEVLVKEGIHPSEIMGERSMKILRATQVLNGVSLFLSEQALFDAARQSEHTHSSTPLLMEINRQAAGWGEAQAGILATKGAARWTSARATALAAGSASRWAAARAGALALGEAAAIAGAETGPGALLTGAAGAVIGGIVGYYGSDWLMHHVLHDDRLSHD